MKKKILRVNMTTKTISVDPMPAKYRLLGGRGLTSTMVCDEVPANCHPLSEDNKLFIAPGLLAGTAAPCSGRLSIGSKSPLTGGIKESNVGGTAAQKIAWLGYGAIVVEGIAEAGALYGLKIDKGGASFIVGSEWKGLSNYALAEVIHGRYGDKVSIIGAGLAGERKYSMASISVTDMEGRPSRHAGRGGMGAVMGAKGLKAIIVDAEGAKSVKPADAEGFKAGIKKLAGALHAHELTIGGLGQFGTAVVVNVINEAGGLPTRNFSAGRFQGAEKISGEAMTENIKARGGSPSHACHPGCIIQCSNVYHDKAGNYVTAGLEYETIALNGSNLGIDDIDVIAQIDRHCDDIGIDTIETGIVLGVAMEAGLKHFGDGPGALELIDEVRKGTTLGRILGNGAAVTGQVLGVSRVPVVKRQGFPAYDPRAIKGIGVTYATSPMGADHTAGYAIANNIMGVGGHMNPLKADGQVEVSRNFQVATAALDTIGYCLFIAFAILDIPAGFEGVVASVSAFGGNPFSAEEFNQMGIDVLLTEKKFNEKAGFGKAHDRLPAFFYKEKLPPHNTVFDVTNEAIDTLFTFQNHK